MESHDLLLVAGEASGDLHGAALLRELEALGVSVNAFGLGGDRLRAEGMKTVSDFNEISVVGLWEVLRTVPKARRVLKDILEEVDRRKPETALLIDFPEFNLRLARKLKSRGVRVLYYISPQVWAWRRGRLKMIGQVVDRMLVFFGFEVDLYKDIVEVTHVGHPLVDEVPRLRQAWESVPAGSLPDEYRIALLPGSRTSEIGRMLPPLLESARLLGQSLPCRFTLVRAASVAEARLQSALDDADLQMDIVSEDRFEAIADSHLALCTSGTATLEVGLLGTPMIVVYRVGVATSWLGRLLIRVPYISLVNLVLGSEVMTELLQGEAQGDRISREATQLLGDRARIEALRERLGSLRQLLGEGGASRRAAHEVAQFLS